MKTYTKIAAVIFGIVAVIHMLRLITHFQVSALGNEIPLWINVLGVIIASVLSRGLWKEAK